MFALPVPRDRDDASATRAGADRPTPDDPQPLVAERPPAIGRADLVVVANRLPVRFERRSEAWTVAPGGLVTALTGVLAKRHGIWIGWNDGPARLPRLDGLQLRGIDLDASAVSGYYDGYANRTLWPALHGLEHLVEHDRVWWSRYREVNERFAAEAAASVRPDGDVWIHDYHLLLAPAMLAEIRPDVRIGLFVHTPVPDPGVLQRLPEGAALLDGIAAATLIGTQTAQDAAHLRAVLTGHAGHGAVEAHPISVDVDAIRRTVADPLVRALAERIRHRQAGGRRMVLGVDRLDYTKGIPERLRAYGQLLDTGAIDPATTVFVQIAAPSRTEVPAYRRLTADVRSLAAEINERHGTTLRQAVRLINDNVPMREVMAHYLAADCLVVTPRVDGMNLVAKEFVTARAGDAAALVLSRGAGAAEALGRHVWTVDPDDPVDLAAGLLAALRASPADRRRSTEACAAAVARHDVHRWASGFLDRLHARTVPS